ncbi:TonB-dependent receptor [Postechiella marina]|uniref:TonB-dependent receptor n=2 Tax=Postechiella marina TaxID=943941 RepID=A0ABP8CGC8_9FLAO
MRSILLALFALICNLNLHAQKLTVQGTVTSATDGLPIPGVTILIEGTAMGTTTDFDGQYVVSANMGDVLTFSYIGMQQQSLKIKSATLNVLLEESIEDLEEVVVIGYGTVKKKEITGAVAQVKAEEIENVITSDISTALQGQVAGVSVAATSGEPGEGSGILIRGVSSLTGSNSPLFVVDGVPQSGDPGLNPNEIDTIDVLKDAASASIYGTRAAGGVILITTKKGKPGNAKISLEISNGVQKITKQTPLLNTQEQIFFDLNNPSINGSPARSDRFSLLNDNDLRDLTENDYARISRYNFNISGGTDDVNYSVVLGYFNQEGTVVNSELKRYNLRSNLNIKKDKWSFENGFGFTVDNRERPNYNLLILGQRAFPYLDEVTPETSSVVNENDESAGPFTQILEALTRDRQTNRYRFEASSNIRYKINKHWELTTLISGVITHEKEKQIQPRFDLFDSNGINLRTDDDNFVFEEREQTILLNWNGGINYNQEFGKHSVSALAMVNIEQDYYTSIAAVNRGLSFTTPVNLSTGSQNPEVVSNGTVSIGGPFFTDPDHKIKRVGNVARVLYDFDDRYLLSVSARLDASNQFSKDNLYAFFPSASASWNISDENFWNRRVVNNFKLRASIGTTGNDRFPANSIYSPVFTGYNAYFQNSSGNSTENTGYVQQSFGNSKLKWEVTTQRNIGVDLGFFKNKLTLTADYYTSDKKDLLSNIALNPSFGSPAAVERFQGSNFAIFNVGNLTNKGFETAIRYRPKTGKVRWNILGTFATNKNEVTKINGETDQLLFGTNIIQGDITARAIGLQVGREAGSFLVWETDGLLRTPEEVADYNSTYNQNAQIGDLKYVSTDGNNVLHEDTDRVYKGSGLPEYELGLNIQATYKNWFFATNWFASIGNEVYNATRANALRVGRHRDLLFQYIPGVNENTDIPAYRTPNRGDLNFNGSSDFFVEDGSFLRLRNVVVSYSLPKDVTEKLGFSRFNIYANAQNVLTITNYSGLDPEVGGNNISIKGIDRGLIPISASFNLGLRLNF